MTGGTSRKTQKVELSHDIEKLAVHASVGNVSNSFIYESSDVDVVDSFLP